MLLHLYIVATLVGAPQHGRGCVPEDRTTRSFISNVKFNIGRRPVGAWHHLIFSPDDSLHVTAVADDSLCDRALQLIREWITDPAARPAAVRIVSAGNFFVAEDVGDSTTHGEFRSQFFLDRSLKTVYFPCRNGQACEP